MIPNEEEKFIEDNFHGKLPLVQIVPTEQMTFPLFDWEAKRFNTWKNEAKIDARIEPLRVILDLNTNKSIVINYFINARQDACPFLVENKCSIYNTKRAYVCRFFPFNRSFLMTKSTENLFGKCGRVGDIANISNKIPSKEVVPYLKDSFPDGSFENAIQFEIVAEWVNKTIIELIKKRIIKPAQSYPYKFLLKRIANSEKIDFTDFLVESNYIQGSDMQELIRRFDNNMDAQEQLKT